MKIIYVVFPIILGIIDYLFIRFLIKRHTKFVSIIPKVNTNYVILPPPPPSAKEIAEELAPKLLILKTPLWMNIVIVIATFASVIQMVISIFNLTK